jgi:hypothetical protein
VATLTSQWGGQTVEEIAQSYIDTWNHWLAGDVYIYTIEDEDGNVEESCGGWLGDEEEAWADALGIADHILAREARKAATA